MLEDLDPLHGGALLIARDGGHAVHEVLVRALRAGDAVGFLPGQDLRYTGYNTLNTTSSTETLADMQNTKNIRRCLPRGIAPSRCRTPHRRRGGAGSRGTGSRSGRRRPQAGPGASQPPWSRLWPSWCRARTLQQKVEGEGGQIKKKTQQFFPDIYYYTRNTQTYYKIILTLGGGGVGAGALSEQGGDEGEGEVGGGVQRLQACGRGADLGVARTPTGSVACGSQLHAASSKSQRPMK